MVYVTKYDQQKLKSTIIFYEMMIEYKSIVRITCITLDVSSRNSDISFILKRLKFPVRLSFVMTIINKSQGQSIDKVRLFVRHIKKDYIIYTW